jgi:hypothetical protein
LWLVLVLFFVDFLPVLQTIQKLSRDLWEIFVITGFIGSLFSTIIEMIIIFVVVFVVVSLYIWRLKIPLISYKFSPKNAILKTENLKSEYGWKLFKKITQDKSFFYLTTTMSPRVLFIPKRAFQNSTDLEKFILLLKEKNLLK